MRAGFPPFEDDDPYQWCRWINGGAGGYLRKSQMEQWFGGQWFPREVCDLFRSTRGLTPAEMDARVMKDSGKPANLAKDVTTGRK